MPELSATLPLEVWRGWCARHRVAHDAVPLFMVDDSGVVQTRRIGRDSSSRTVLCRSQAMESRLLTQTDILVQDWEAGRHRYDGLLYVMGLVDGDDVTPLYIGKAETTGRMQGNLSANMTRLHRDRSKFARWGDNYAYHIGDLSACALSGHAEIRKSSKYQAWADALFVETGTTRPCLRRPVHFWSMAWPRDQVGVWQELGPTPLAFQEYLLIGVAGLAFPELLNREGSRRARQPWHGEESGSLWVRR